MKKALSIILCLSMLMTSFPATVFAAPVMAPIIGDSVLETEQAESKNEAQQDAEGLKAELAAELTVSPVKVLPDTGATVDYRYPVAYYTFGEDVVINAEEVTMENINNENVGGVYFEKDTNTVWVFPWANTITFGSTVSFSAWTSNIAAENGEMLYFPAVSFVLSNVPADDGENLAPFADFEYGWSPFYFEDQKPHRYVEEADGTINGVGLRKKVSNYNHFYTRVLFKPNTTYKVEYTVKSEDQTTGTFAVKPCAYYKPANEVHRLDIGALVGVPLNTWGKKSFEFKTDSANTFATTNKDMQFSIYSEPNNGGVSFYLDDFKMYEKVNMTFEAVVGKSALKGQAPATLYGYNGDKVTLPTASNYFEAVAENYSVAGWTDGKNVYSDGQTIEVKGCKVFTPYLVPTGEAVTVTFNVPADAADYYNGLAEVKVNKGEKINLDDYGFNFVAGYDVFWADAQGQKVEGEYVVEDSVTFVATLKFREGEKFDSTKPVTGSVILNNLAVPTVEYSYLDVTLVKTENTPTTEGSEYGRIYFLAGGMTDYSTVQSTAGVFAGYADAQQTKPIYRYNLAACDGYEGVCSAVRFDSHDATTPFGIDEMKFVKNDFVDTVEITDVVKPVLGQKPSENAAVSTDAPYIIEKITWDCSSYFGASTRYTVTASVKIKKGVAGLMFGDTTTAKVNTFAAEVELDKHDASKAKVKYTFGATDDAAEIVVTINNSKVINKNNGTLVLDATVEPKNPADADKVNPRTVEWSLVSGGEFASLDGNVLTAIWDGTVVIAATPNYNPSEQVMFDVVISGQKGWTVKYNTLFSDVTKPADESVKFDYTLSTQVPEKSGYIFRGWVKDPATEQIITQDYVTEDTTYYALWMRGVSHEFNGDPLPKSISTYFTDNGQYYPEKGVYTTTATTGTDPQIKFDAKGLPGAELPVVEVRFRTTAKSSLNTYVYFTSKDENGNYLSRPWVSGDPTNNYSKNAVYKSFPNNNNEFVVVRIDMSERADWMNGYLDEIRIDPFDGNKGAFFEIDYIRLVNYAASAVEIQGVDIPKTKKKDTTAAVAADTSKYTITESYWTPELLGGMYFDEDTDYTFTAKIAIKDGLFIPETFGKATISGFDADVDVIDDKTAVLTYTFDTTEDVYGELKLAEMKLHQMGENGMEIVPVQSFVNEEFDLSDYAPAFVPTGIRWIGWSETEGGEVIEKPVKVTEGAEFYAIYEAIENFDYSNKYHVAGTTTSLDGTLKFKDGWAVVTPTGEADEIKLYTPYTALNAADYAKVEVIYNGSLESVVNGKVVENKFNKGTIPELYFQSNGQYYKAEYQESESLVVDSKVAYKYIYNLTASENWSGEIGSIMLNPYVGYPAWAVRSIKFIRNEATEDAVVITGIDKPETWEIPDTNVEVNDKYTVAKAVEWTPALNEYGKFNPDTPYTVSVTVKPLEGFKIVNTAAEIGGFAETGVINPDGSMTVSHTFDNTDPLIKFDFSIDDYVIDGEDKAEYKVVGNFEPVNEGEEIPVKDIKVRIVDFGGDSENARMLDGSEDTIKAVLNSTIVIEATSVYDPSKTDRATITITGLDSKYNIFYDANCANPQDVTNMPKNTTAKLEYTLDNTVPKRAGYVFGGWVKKPGDTDPVETDNITKDTTYYALWLKGAVWNFGSESEAFTFSSGRTATFKDGIAYLTGGNKATTDFVIMQLSNIYNLGISTSKYNQLQVCISLPAGGDFKTYVRSTLDGTDENSSLWKESASITLKGFKANAQGEFQIITFDLSKHAPWTQYPTARQLRFDSSANIGLPIEINWVRLAAYETKEIEISGIDTPVAKAVVDTTAESLTPEIKVVNVDWSPDPIHNKYYFGGNTAYTVAVTVEGANGYYVSEAPDVYTINGLQADRYEYVPENENHTGQLILYKTFPATGELLPPIDLVKVEYVEEDKYAGEYTWDRSMFAGSVVNLSEFVPNSIPDGKRWLGWSETKNGAVIEEPAVVNDNVKYYAVYEEITEFDYAKPSHQRGTTSMDGDKGISFDGDLAIVKVPASGVDTALFTPAINFDSKKFGKVEVYYSATLTGVVDGELMKNPFNASLIAPKPALYYSFEATPDSWSGSGNLVAAECVQVGDTLTYKYTYEMPWSGIIGKLKADPYTVGNDSNTSKNDDIHIYPDWGIRKIVLVPNEVITDEVNVSFASPEAQVAVPGVENVSVNAPYKIESIEWTGTFDGVGNNRKFKAETEYTATVVVNTEYGYVPSSAVNAKINGADATVDYNNDNGVLTITYKVTTPKVKDVNVVITGPKLITDSGSSIRLSATVTGANGEFVPVTDVKWHVDNKQFATVDEITGRVYPLRDGTVKVFATSLYNPAAVASHTITIQGQTELYEVVFKENTTDEVNGMPASIETRGVFEPEVEGVARDGYIFLGWSVDEDALEPDDNIVIDKDTILYAKWAKGYEWSFSDASTSLNFVAGRTVMEYKDGIAYVTGGSTASGQQLIMQQEGLHTRNISTADYKRVVARVSIPAGGDFQVFLRSSDMEGNNKSVWNNSAQITISGNKPNADGEFQNITFNTQDVMSKDGANFMDYPYFYTLRFDSVPNMGLPIAVDYVRLYDDMRSVKFDGNGGLIPRYDDYVDAYKQNYECGTINLRSVPVREDYTFVGWSKDPTSYDKLYNGTFTVTDDVTLYAMWMPGSDLTELDKDAREEILSGSTGVENIEHSSDENGIHISSQTVVTPVIKLADKLAVNEEQKTLALVLDYSYSNVVTDKFIIGFVAEDGTPVSEEIVLQKAGTAEDDPYIVDLSSIPEYKGNVSNVTLTFPEGVVENITFKEYAVADKNTAQELGKVVFEYSEPGEIVIGEESTDKTVFPEGEGYISSHTGSTSIKPNKTVTDSSSADGGSGTTKPSTPSSANYVVGKTSASGDVVFDFDTADDEKLISWYRHMEKASMANGVLTIKNKGSAQGSNEAPAFFGADMELDAASHRYIIIKNNCTYGADTVRVYFKTSTSASYDETKTVNGKMSGGTMGYTVIDMGINKAWAGTITGLFFSLGNKVGNIEIDSIIFTNNKNYVAQSAFQFVNTFSASTFNDVKSSDWFYGDVEKSYKIGLMNGKGEGGFDPNGNVTIAEAITLAARLNALYNGKAIDQAKDGESWYAPYVSFATNAGIIKAGQFTDYNKSATRSEVAVMFANAMPQSWFTAKNNFTSIPDVASSDAAFKQIVMLYNAGVIIGVDDAHNFKPADNIKRSEISAIINRVALPESRIKA